MRGGRCRAGRCDGAAALPGAVIGSSGTPIGSSGTVIGSSGTVGGPSGAVIVALQGCSSPDASGQAPSTVHVSCGVAACASLVRSSAAAMRAVPR
ncbi:hypothetical protein ID867_14820 [Streptomyces parvulus]|nr:hypothetical protein [Streptomyces parvulus]